MAKVIDLTGKRFGRLTAVSLSHIDRNAYWNCVCDCGGKSVVTGNNLKRGKVISCGCYKKEYVSKQFKKHGDSNTRFYGIWGSLISRTTNQNNARYGDYGGRGIGVCERWLDYQNFKHEMYQSYLEHISIHGKKDTTIERMDNNKGYSSSNCRWATNKEQNSNTRKTRLVTYNGETLFLAEMARKYGFINPSTLGYRIRNGWDIERAITTPVKEK